MSKADGQIADALRSGTFATVLGDLAFDGRGDVVGGPPWQMLRWSAGRYAPVGRWLPGMWTEEGGARSRPAAAQAAPVGGAVPGSASRRRLTGGRDSPSRRSRSWSVSGVTEHAPAFLGPT